MWCIKAFSAKLLLFFFYKASNGLFWNHLGASSVASSSSSCDTKDPKTCPSGAAVQLSRFQLRSTRE